jgi:hypothetical protein
MYTFTMYLGPPFPTFRVSPISVIPKKSSTEFRLIHNLSFPPNNSVNDFIDREHCSVKYSSIDDAVKMIHDLGRNALLAKCDIKSAFRLLRLAPNEFDLTVSNSIPKNIRISVGFTVLSSARGTPHCVHES